MIEERDMREGKERRGRGERKKRERGVIDKRKNKRRKIFLDIYFPCSSSLTR